jgi:hypothetical protein
VKSTKTRIAAVATILGLGGLTGIALSAGGQKADPLAAKPLVRTKVIHRTVKVTKHVKPKHPVAAGGAGYASAAGSSDGTAPVTTASSGTGASEPAPVTTATSGTGGEATPVTTAASGTGGAGGGEEIEHESEGEGGFDD